MKSKILASVIFLVNILLVAVSYYKNKSVASVGLLFLLFSLFGIFFIFQPLRRDKLDVFFGVTNKKMNMKLYTRLGLSWFFLVFSLVILLFMYFSL